MSKTMTPAQADKWLKDVLKQVSRNGKGLIPEFRTVGKMLKRKHAGFLKSHKGPDRKAWAKTYSKPLPKVGEVAPTLVRDGEIIPPHKIRSSREKRYAKAFREKYGPPPKGKPALHRGGKRAYALSPTKWIMTALVTNVLAREKTIAKKLGEARIPHGKSALQYGPNWLAYGFSPSMQWVTNLQYGGRFGGGKRRKEGAPKIPPRMVVGLTGGMQRFIVAQVAKGWRRILAKA